MQQQLTLKTTILQALENNGYLSGYRLFKEVQKGFSLKPFQVYQTLYELEDQGWITGDWRTENGRQRKHYKPAGGKREKAPESTGMLGNLAGFQSHH